MTLPISDASIADIIGYEVGSEAQYSEHVTWPGGASGLTIGFGYDLGYASAAQVLKDWGKILPAGVVVRLQSYAGRKAASAHSALFATHDILVPWEAAETVFRQQDIPRYTDMTARAFQHCDELSPDSLGGLVSVVFNRGCSMVDTQPGNRLEMRQIRDAMAARQFSLVPGFIRAMKRLWKGQGLDGLLARRDGEAARFEAGLSDIGIPISASPAPPAGRVIPAENCQKYASSALHPATLSTSDLNDQEAQRLGLSTPTTGA